MFESACLFDSAIGACGLAWSRDGLTGIQLPMESCEKTTARITRYGATGLAEADVAGGIPAIIAALKAFLSGQPTDFAHVRLDMQRHSAFEQATYAALRKVPWGQTVTYGDLARALGDPGAARAVGVALGRNSWPLIVPCHRVLGAQGWIGGFSAPGGTLTKKALLEREGVYPDGGQLALFE